MPASRWTVGVLLQLLCMMASCLLCIAVAGVLYFRVLQRSKRRPPAAWRLWSQQQRKWWRPAADGMGSHAEADRGLGGRYHALRGPHHDEPAWGRARMPTPAATGPAEGPAQPDDAGGQTAPAGSAEVPVEADLADDDVGGQGGSLVGAKGGAAAPEKVAAEDQPVATGQEEEAAEEEPPRNAPWPARFFQMACQRLRRMVNMARRRPLRCLLNAINAFATLSLCVMPLVLLGAPEERVLWFLSLPFRILGFGGLDGEEIGPAVVHHVGDGGPAAAVGLGQLLQQFALAVKPAALFLVDLAATLLQVLLSNWWLLAFAGLSLPNPFQRRQKKLQKPDVPHVSFSPIGDNYDRNEVVFAQAALGDDAAIRKQKHLTMRRTVKSIQLSLLNVEGLDVDGEFASALKKRFVDTRVADKLVKLKDHWHKQAADIDADLNAVSAMMRAGLRSDGGMFKPSLAQLQRARLRRKYHSLIDRKVQEEMAFIRAVNKLAQTAVRATAASLRHTGSPSLDILLMIQDGSPPLQDAIVEAMMAPFWENGSELPNLGTFVPSPSEVGPATQGRVFFFRFNNMSRQRSVDEEFRNMQRFVTAIVQVADPARGDEVLLALDCPGGAVTSFGVASAQLERIKQAGLKLTVCVDEVAASGGYELACVGDKIVAGPGAVLGSIGVIASVPNFYERATREGVAFNDITSGEYKRTLTRFKPIDDKDVKKVQEELEMVHAQFKRFVERNRPSLDIERVATGEIWYGTDALDMNLCDEIGTLESVLLRMVRDEGKDVYKLAWKRPVVNGRGFGGLGLLPGLVASARRAVRSFGSALAHAGQPAAPQLEGLLRDVRPTADPATLRDRLPQKRMVF